MAESQKKRTWFDELLSAMGADTLPQRSRAHDVLGSLESGTAGFPQRSMAGDMLGAAESSVSTLPQRSVAHDMVGGIAQGIPRLGGMRPGDILDAVEPFDPGVAEKRQRAAQLAQQQKALEYQIGPARQAVPELDEATLRRIVGEMQGATQGPPPGVDEYPGNVYGFSLNPAPGASTPPGHPVGRQGFEMSAPTGSATPYMRPNSQSYNLQQPPGGSVQTPSRRSMLMQQQAPMAPVAPPQQEAAPGPTSRLFSDQEMRRSLLEAMQGSGAVSPDEPFVQKAALSEAQKRYEDKANRLDLFAGLTESGQKFANTVRTSGEIMLGIKPEQYEATALRDAAARKREEISPAERDYYASMGIDVPEGMTRAQFKTGIPITLQQGQMPIEFARQQSADARAAERNAIGAERNEIARGTSEENRRVRETLARRPSENAASDLAALQRSISELDVIESRKGSHDTGPISSAAHTAAGWAGMNSADFAGFKARTQGTFNAVLKALSGSAVTGNEYARAQAAFPQVWDQDDVFLSKLKEFREATREGFEILKKFHEARGSDMGEFNLAPGGASSSEWIPMIDPETGKAEAVHPDDVAESERNGWKRR